MAEDEGAPAHPDGIILAIDLAATAVVAVTALLGLLIGSPWVGVLVVISGVLFASGLVASLWAFAIAVNRSRHDQIGPAQLYLLTGGCAPDSVRNRFAMILLVQSVVGVAAAAAAPFTGMAFAVLVPMAGIGASGLWGARNGRFPPRVRPDGAPPAEDRQE